MMLMVQAEKRSARLQIALQYELSLYHFTPETRRVGLFITKRASVLLNNSSMLGEDATGEREKFNRRAVRLMACV
jgi:hypothetical protein